MGNRAVITFDTTPHAKSLGVYLHWNGGAESVAAFVQALDDYKVRNDGDYELARFIQIIGNYFGGGLSLGVGTLDSLDCDNGDNGLFIVSRNGTTRIENIPDGKYTGKGNRETVDLDAIRKHTYWRPDHKGENIMSQVHAANDAAFKKRE